MRIISLKNIAVLILISIISIACNSPAGISGNLDSTDKTDLKVYLIKPESLRDVAGSYYGKVLDSAVVNVDGDFSFTTLPKTTEPMLLELAVQVAGDLPNYLQTDDPSKSNYMPLVWQSGASIQITAKFEEFQKSFAIENPSEINKALLDLRDINQSAFQKFLLGKEWNLEHGEQLLEMEHAILNYQSELIKFANQTSYLLPALVALRWVSPINDYERVPEFLVSQCDKWTVINPEHPWAKQLCIQSQPSNLPVLVGSVFPNLKLPMITNDTIFLNDQLGSKLTIIDLWASWCAPCRIENREVLGPIWAQYNTKGVQIIGLSLEGNAASWIAASERDGANLWPQASELQGDDTPFLRRIRVRTIPSNFILDERGVVVAKNVHGEALIDWVKNYLTEK
jgi:thiol-disulfide isomerase/thioredoxin